MTSVAPATQGRPRRWTRAHRSVRRRGSDLLGGAAATAAGVDLRDLAVGDERGPLKVGQPSAQGALTVHPDRLGVPAGDRAFAADVAGASHGRMSLHIT